VKDAIKVERDAFLDVATSSEGKAGMRFFFTQQAVQRLPKGFPGKARELEKVGVDGADGFMGNAIAWLALEAGFAVVAHVPIEKFVPAVKEKLTAKYGRALKKGSMSPADLDAKLGRVQVTTNVKDLQGSDLVIEARMENREIKAEFYRALGKGIAADTLVASNSSSMGPAVLAPFFAEGGGSPKNFLNLHFFSPAEHPMMQLVEVIRGKDTTGDAVATAHAFVRKINKTPVILNDGSAGFPRERRARRVHARSGEDLSRGHAGRDDRRSHARDDLPDGPVRARRLGRPRHRRRDVRHDRRRRADRAAAAGLEAPRREALRHQERRRHLRLCRRQADRRMARPRRARPRPRQPRREQGRDRRALREGALREGARARRPEDRRLGRGV
jgi:hypothetical protein